MNQSKEIEEGIEGLGGTLPPIGRGCSSLDTLSIAFRITFTTKEQLKSRRALQRIFLKPQYKVYRGVSILYFNASFLMFPLFQNISTPN